MKVKMIILQGIKTCVTKITLIAMVLLSTFKVSACNQNIKKQGNKFRGENTFVTKDIETRLKP